MKPNESELYNREKARLMRLDRAREASVKRLPQLGIYYVCQIKYASKEAACLTKLHLTELGYEAEVIKVAV